MENESKKLLGEVEKLNVLLAQEIKLQSFGRSLIRGIATSFGWVLGIAIVLTVSAYLFETYSGIPIIGKILEYLNLAAGRGK